MNCKVLVCILCCLIHEKVEPLVVLQWLLCLGHHAYWPSYQQATGWYPVSQLNETHIAMNFKVLVCILYSLMHEKVEPLVVLQWLLCLGLHAYWLSYTSVSDVTTYSNSDCHHVQGISMYLLLFDA